MRDPALLTKRLTDEYRQWLRGIVHEETAAAYELHLLHGILLYEKLRLRGLMRGQNLLATSFIFNLEAVIARLPDWVLQSDRVCSCLVYLSMALDDAGVTCAPLAQPEERPAGI